MILVLRQIKLCLWDNKDNPIVVTVNKSVYKVVNKSVYKVVSSILSEWHIFKALCQMQQK